MRLIDADELMKSFRYTEADTFDERMMNLAVRRIIKEQPTIEPSKADCWGCKCSKMEQTQWIPVSERLPKEYEDVLVTLVATKNGGYTGVAMDCYAYDDKWYTHHRDNVIAWMPLPEPYKGDDSE